MSFADWKKRSTRYQLMSACHFVSKAEAEEVCQAAYKAGERDGRKQAEEVAKQALALRELMEEKS